MLRVWFHDDILHIDDDKPRLVSLTIYNGCPDVALHYITKEDVARLLKTLLKRAGECPTCGQGVD